MLQPHDAVGGERIRGEACQEIEYPREVFAYPSTVELPSGKPCLVADSTAEQLASAPQPVHRLRGAQLQQLLYLWRPHRPVDEVLDERRTPLIAQLARCDSLEGALWGRRRGEQCIEDSGESRVLQRSSRDLMSERRNGGSHASSLRPVGQLKQSKQMSDSDGSDGRFRLVVFHHLGSDAFAGSDG